jgi:ferrochelatase
MEVKTTKRRLAVVLFNLGGPDSLEVVQPFLFALFQDPAIIRLPQPFRWMIAKLISRRRAPEAQKIYRALGGRSPLLQETKNQAAALEALLCRDNEAQVFVAMRHWHPKADEVAQSVAAFKPQEVILLPLYPQFSSTTTASSFKDWNRAADLAGITAPTRTVCCYPALAGLVEAHAERIIGAIEGLADSQLPRLLFSAHGLPEKIVMAGDPYAFQVEATVQAVVSALKDRLEIYNLDYVICYQSRVGPLKWLEPSSEQEITRAGEEGRAILVIPISFVSEHSETLYELDIQYAELAREKGVPAYNRVEALRCHGKFIEALAGLVENAIGGKALGCGQGDRCCPAGYKDCPIGEQVD